MRWFLLLSILNFFLISYSESNQINQFGEIPLNDPSFLKLMGYARNKTNSNTPGGLDGVYYKTSVEFEVLTNDLYHPGNRALYDPNCKCIYLNNGDGFYQKSPITGDSFKVHEIVHSIQDDEGRMEVSAACKEDSECLKDHYCKIESEAYRIQNQYLRTRGMSGAKGRQLYGQGCDPMKYDIGII